LISRAETDKSAIELGLKRIDGTVSLPGAKKAKCGNAATGLSRRGRKQISLKQLVNRPRAPRVKGNTGTKADDDCHESNYEK